MLPNHPPLVIAEQFGTLESMYPGRIDLGLGRAPGSDQLTAMALRRDIRGAGNDFPENLVELRKYLSAENSSSKVRAIPGEGLDIPIWLLGSSTYSAQLAAILGLPFAFASHFAPTYLYDAIRIYRDTFKPSEKLRAPYVLTCVNVVAADTDEEAGLLSTSLYQLAMGIIHGSTKPLQPPVENMDDVWNEYEKAAILQMMQYSFVGGPATVKERLQAFVNNSQSDEIMITSHIYDHVARLRSYEIISQLWKE
jgi:luciferase family oxidoreductase group 1